MPEQSDPKSDYPELSLPPDGWKSNIPAHLLSSADPEMKWLMEEMSKNTQATEWNSHAALSTNIQVRKTNGRLKGAEAKIITLQDEVSSLKDQMAVVSPIVSTLTTTKKVVTNKVFLVILGMSILFLLGYNRDIIPTIIKLFFG